MVIREERKTKQSWMEKRTTLVLEQIFSSQKNYIYENMMNKNYIILYHLYKSFEP